MRFFTCSLFRIRNVEIISKWGSIPAVSQQCILLESAVVVDAEHQFWIRGHVKAEISKCHLFGENWFFLGSYEGRNIDRNFLAKLKVCDKIFFDSAQRYRAMHEVRQSFAILKSQACTTTASWEFCINLTFTEQFIFDENPQIWQFWCRKISPASRFHDFAEMLFVTNLYWPKHLQEAK